MAPKTTATGNCSSAPLQQHQEQQSTNDIPPPYQRNIRIIERPHGHATTFNLAGHCLAQHKQLPPHPQDTTDTDTVKHSTQFCHCLRKGTGLPLGRSSKPPPQGKRIHFERDNGTKTEPRTHFGFAYSFTAYPFRNTFGIRTN